MLTGSATFTTGTIEGVERLDVTADSDETIVSLTGQQFAQFQRIEGHVGDGQAISLRVRLAPGDSIHNPGLMSGVSLQVEGSRRADTIDRLYGDVIVHGNGGNDVITAGDFTIYGDAGDDTIDATVSSTALRDGGDGVDTLIFSGQSSSAISIDLSVRDQGISGVGAIAGFENVDLTRSTPHGGASTVLGSAGDNIICGSYEADVLRGGGGDDTLFGTGASPGSGGDVLDGGSGDDLLFGSSGFSGVRMTGGSGTDTFRWSYRANEVRVDPMDSVTDYKPGTDHLQFLRSVFGFDGNSFDALVVAANRRTDITNADLVLYRGGVLDSVDDVVGYINNAKGGSASGVFIAGFDSDGNVVLYHSLSGQYADERSISPIANLGDLGSLTNLTLSDFTFL